jgi:hypothetical protein
MGTQRRLISRPAPGARFGHLRFVDERPGAMWLMECDCGEKKQIGRKYISRGSVKSCGCHQQAHLRTHGLSGTRAYRSWQAIKRRCNDPNDRHFHNYGGSGVRIAPEWERDFHAFFKHVGEAPSPSHSIDRIDNRRGYEPGNVRWADRATQARNRSNNVWLNVLGWRLCMADAADASPLTRQAVFSRLRRGWTPFDAISTTPKRRERNRAWKYKTRRTDP